MKAVAVVPGNPTASISLLCPSPRSTRFQEATARGAIKVFCEVADLA